MNTGLLVINFLATLFMLKKKVITFSLGASALSLVAMLVIQLSML